MSDPTTTPTPTETRQDRPQWVYERGFFKCSACGSPLVVRDVDDATAAMNEHRCPAPSCADCGRHYGDEHGFPDLVIPDDVWARISPKGNEGGLLCPSCICRRLHLAGIETTGRFTSGPLAAVSAAAPDEWALGVAADLIDWLADARDEYASAGGPYADAIHQETALARTLAKALRSPEDAWGWLPTWMVPEYEARHAAALAARPAPTVNAGPLRVEYGLVWDDLGSADTFPTLEQARAAARGLDEPAQVVRIETWPVADEGRAEA